MPYLLLVIGLLIGLFALYRFFITANVHQVKALFMTAAFTVFGAALFFLAVTGRLPAAIAMIAALIPLGIGYVREKYKEPPSPSEPDIIDLTPIEDEDKNKS